MSECGSSTCSGQCQRSGNGGLDLADVDGLVARIGRRPEDLIPLLQAIQKRFNYLPAPALERLCQITAITPDAVTGVSTFYSQFRHYPVGQHIIKTCVGTACHVQGASVLKDTLHRQLKIADSAHTDPAGEFTVEEVACLG